MLTMLDKSFNYLTALSEYQSRKYNFEEFNEDPYDEFSTYELRQARYDRAMEQKNLETLYKKREQLANDIQNRETRMANGNYDILGINSYNKDWTALYGTNGEGGGLFDQKAQIDLEIEAAEGKVSELETYIAGMNTTKDVTFDVDSSKVDSWQPPHKYGTVTYQEGFANGGRATTASVFGEAGPEWAIPEQHSERTAELLNAARRASGFTWGDLVSRFGGLNANPNNSPVVLNYSPVINANDTSGVAGALAADKDRVLKLIRNALSEAKYRDSVEAYA